MVSQHDTKLLNKDVANNEALDGTSLSKNQNTLDVLREKGVTNFESVWGTSAGAINSVSFKSKQIGRAMRIMLAFRDDPRFMSFRSLVTTGNIAGGEFMYKEIQNHLDPCDNEAFNSNPMQMYAVASDVTFGTPAYLHVKSLPDDIKMVQASASMPTVIVILMVGQLIQFPLQRRLVYQMAKLSILLLYLTINLQRKRWSLLRRITIT